MNKKITSLDDLNRLRDQAKNALDLRTGNKDIRVTVHMGTCGIASGARDVMAALMSELGRAGIDNVMITQSGCAGLCEHEPMLTLADRSGRQVRYGKLDKNKVKEIVRQHIVNDSPIVDFMINT